MDTWECEQPEWLETLKILRHHKEILDSAYNANPLPDTPNKKRKIDPEYSTGIFRCQRYADFIYFVDNHFEQIIEQISIKWQFNFFFFILTNLMSLGRKFSTDCCYY